MEIEPSEVGCSLPREQAWIFSQGLRLVTTLPHCMGVWSNQGWLWNPQQQIFVLHLNTEICTKVGKDQAWLLGVTFEWWLQLLEERRSLYLALSATVPKWLGCCLATNEQLVHLLEGGCHCPSPKTRQSRELEKEGVNVIVLILDLAIPEAVPWHWNFLNRKS